MSDRVISELVEIGVVKWSEAAAACKRRWGDVWSPLSARQRAVAITALVATAASGIALACVLGGRGGPAAGNSIVLIDATSGDCVTVVLRPGMGEFPLVNPKTGRATLWPAEFCYSATCTARGGTAVVLNRYLGKPEPTHCPRCGALVTLFNSRPVARAGWGRTP